MYLNMVSDFPVYISNKKRGKGNISLEDLVGCITTKNVFVSCDSCTKKIDCNFWNKED